jgi:hypothetical protein
VDKRIVEIKGKKFKAVFDTGTSDNMVCSAILNEIGGAKVDGNCKQNKYFDGGTNVFIGMTTLEFLYDGVKYMEDFNIVDAPHFKNILLSNTTVHKINIKEKIPIEYCIYTGDATLVTWSRQIRSYKDKIDFEKINYEMEKKGFIGRVS